MPGQPVEATRVQFDRILVVVTLETPTGWSGLVTGAISVVTPLGEDGTEHPAIVWFFPERVWGQLGSAIADVRGRWEAVVRYAEGEAIGADGGPDPVLPFPLPEPERWWCLVNPGAGDGPFQAQQGGAGIAEVGIGEAAMGEGGAGASPARSMLVGVCRGVARHAGSLG